MPIAFGERIYTPIAIKGSKYYCSDFGNAPRPLDLSCESLPIEIQRAAFRPRMDRIRGSSQFVIAWWKIRKF